MLHACVAALPEDSACLACYAATQACCTANEVSEIHIAGDVSLAMWQTFQASHDLNW